jgi:hypothetical protein
MKTTTGLFARSVLGLVLGLLLGVALDGCGTTPRLPTMGPPSACGDKCSAMVCPSGSRCTFGAGCTPLCEPQPLPMP